MWFTINSVGSQHLDLQYFKLLLHTVNDVPQLLKCFVWDTQRKFSDYWVIVTGLLQLVSVLTFHCNEVIFKLPPRSVLQYLLKPKGGWAQDTVSNFVTPGMDFASGPFLLPHNHPETLDNITCTSLWHNVATSYHKTQGKILLTKSFGNVTFPRKTSVQQRQQKGNSHAEAEQFCFLPLAFHCHLSHIVQI